MVIIKNLKINIKMQAVILSCDSYTRDTIFLSKGRKNSNTYNKTISLLFKMRNVEYCVH